MHGMTTHTLIHIICTRIARLTRTYVWYVWFSIRRNGIWLFFFFFTPKHWLLLVSQFSIPWLITQSTNGSNGWFVHGWWFTIRDFRDRWPMMGTLICSRDQEYKTDFVLAQKQEKPGLRPFKVKNVKVYSAQYTTNIVLLLLLLCVLLRCGLTIENIFFLFHLSLLLCLLCCVVSCCVFLFVIFSQLLLNHVDLTKNIVFFASQHCCCCCFVLCCAIYLVVLCHVFFFVSRLLLLLLSLLLFVGSRPGAQVQTCGTLAWVTCIEDMRSPYKPYPKTVRRWKLR